MLSTSYVATFVRIVTTRDPAERGCQLTVHFDHSTEVIYKSLRSQGVVVRFF